MMEFLKWNFQISIMRDFPSLYEPYHVESQPHSILDREQLHMHKKENNIFQISTWFV